MHTKKNKVDFFLVGLPKTGTTSIYKSLVKHKKIYIPNIKEPNYFCFDKHFSSYFNYKKKIDYLKLFNRGFSENLICGDLSTEYFDSKVAPKEIYNHNKNAKIIIILRDHFDFICSYLKELRKSYNVKIDITNIFKTKKDESKFLEELNYRSQVYNFEISDKLNYSKKIDKFHHYFKNSILLINYKELSDNYEKEINKILNFLDLDSNHYILKKEYINQSTENYNSLIYNFYHYLKKIKISQFSPVLLNRYIGNLLLLIASKTGKKYNYKKNINFKKFILNFTSQDKKNIKEKYGIDL